MNLKDFRAQYPMYDSMSDEDLVNGLHEKFYSNMPLEDFHKRIEYAPAKATKVTTPAPASTAPPEDEGFFSHLTRTAGNTLPQFVGTAGAAQAVTGLALGKLGASDTGKEYIEKGLEKMKYAEEHTETRETDEFTNALHKGVGSVMSEWLPSMIGSGVGNAAETLAFMGLGAGVGALTGAGVGAIPGAVAGAVEKTLVKQGIKNAAKEIAEKEIEKNVAKGMAKTEAKVLGKTAADKFYEAEATKVAQDMVAKAAYRQAAAKGIGATAGMVGQAGIHGAGEVTGQAYQAEQQRAQQEGRETDINNLDLTRIIPAAVLHSAADYFNEKIGLGALNLPAAAGESLILDVLKNIFVTGTKETGGELAQTILERFGAHLSLADADALNDYINTIAASYGMSVGPGTVGGVKAHLVTKVGTQQKTAEGMEEIRRKGTSAGEVKDNVASATDAETLAGLTPAVGKVGKNKVALAEEHEDTKTAKANISTTQPSATDQVAAVTTPTETKELTPLKPAELKMTAEEIEDYIEKNKDVKGAKRKNTLKKIERLQTRLEELKNVEQPNGQPGGTSTEVVQPADQGQPATGAAGPDTNGVVSTGQDAGVPNAGAITKPPSITVQNAQGTVNLLKQRNPKLLDQVTELHAQDMTAGQIAKQLNVDVDLIRDIRLGLNLPSQGKASGNSVMNVPGDAQERATFEAWRDKYNASKTPVKVSPETQKKIDTLEVSIQQLKAQGVPDDNKTLKRQQDQLNKLKNAVKPGPKLSAKREVEFSPYVYDEDQSPEENVQAAIELGDLHESLHEATLKEQLEESKQKKAPSFEATEKQREDYDAMREESQQEAESHNEKRKELVAELERLDQEHDDALREKHEAEDSGNTEAAVDASRRAEEAFDQYIDAEKALNDHGETKRGLPRWRGELQQDEKDVYFSHIRGKGTPAQHRKAKEVLLNYLNSKKSRPTEHQRVINSYDENRGTAGTRLGIKFPSWEQLSDKAKSIYLKEIVNNAGLQQDQGFAKLAQQLNVENKEATEREKIQEAKRIQERIEKITKESEEQQRKDQKLRDNQRRNASAYISSASFVPDKVVRMIRDNNLQGVLGYLKDTVYSNRDLYKVVANLLHGMNLNTNIKLVSQMPDKSDDLAQYDPETNTIYLSKEGLTASTILHEVVHAATVKVLSHYLSGNHHLLTPAQLQAAKQLEAIMNETRDQLGAKYSNAYKNLLEFVAYAMTTKELQNDLSKISPDYKLYEVLGLNKQVITSQLPGKRSQWSAFKNSVAKIIGITKSKAYDPSKPNFMLEVAGAFEDIMAVPTEPIHLPEVLSAKKPSEKEELKRERQNYNLKKEEKPKNWREILNIVGTAKGWASIGTVFQSDSTPIRIWEADLAKAGMIEQVGDKVNNIYEQLTLTAAKAKNFFNRYLDNPIADLHRALAAYTEAVGYKTIEAKNISGNLVKKKPLEQAIEQLHMYLEAIHEPERRMVKFIMSVPLNVAKNLVHNGKKISAVARRADIIKLLNSKNLTKGQAQQLRTELDNMIFQKDSAGNIVYINGVPQVNKLYVDPAGESPYGMTSTDLTNQMYNATGLPLKSDKFMSVEKIMNEFNSSPHKKEIQAVIDALQVIHTRTAELNRIGNYWSQPVSNRVAFYGWQNYVPLKGTNKNQGVDEILDFDSKKMGRDLQEAQASFDGRFTTSNNPILQTISDATRSALRAGRRNYTLAIKNAIEQGLIPGGKVGEKIPFDEREKIDLAPEKTKNNIIHYNEDGSIQILTINNDKLLNAIRRSYEKVNPFLKVATTLTGGFGQFHTRYNYAFPPMNFVRDTIQNTFIKMAEEGPIEAAKYATAVAAQVIGNRGLYKAYKFASLYKNGDDASIVKLNDLVKKDAYIADMADFSRYGGMTTVLEGVGLKSAFEEINKDINRSGVVKTKEAADKVIDTWIDMFEFASRTSAYSLKKKQIVKELLARGKTEQQANEAAMESAAAYAKNLANFEQTSKGGKLLGSAFMFFRPSATGAARNVQALVPAFRSLKDVVEGLPDYIKNDPAALESFKQKYAKEQLNARITTVVLISLGSLAYTMAYSVADDDDFGRNEVATDNMQQWQRYARFHIPKSLTKDILGINEPVVFQMPWGFGLGALASMGAQITAAGMGHQSWGDAGANVFSSMLDSFLPIPFSKMSPKDDPGAWLVDSLMPSVARPIVEFVMNKNGLGQKIYSDQNRRLGDAYTGGDNIPEMYKDAAQWIFNNGIFGSDIGEHDISPNTLYFLANNYFDGIGRIAETAYGLPDLTHGERDFNPRTDTFLFNSFFGARSNVDSREFTQVEAKIEDMKKALKTLDEKNPMGAIAYEENHPFARQIIDIYNHQVNGELRELRHRATMVRTDPNLGFQDKKDQLKQNIELQNIIKRNMLDTFEAYDIKP